MSIDKHCVIKPSSVVKNLLSCLSFKPYRDVLFVSEGMDWVTTQEIIGVVSAIEKLGIRTRFSGPLVAGLPRQSIFYPSAYFLRYPYRYLTMGGRIAFPFYHGYPSSGNELVLTCHKNLKKYHPRISRIQVSHSYMRDIILESGIDKEKVFLIPIAIADGIFEPQTTELKKQYRQKYEIPNEAVVIGSFQKDGEGWGEGLEPKLVKGPDTFLKTVKILKESVPELFVLLSGPARGYVKKGLEELKIPYKHVYLKNYPEIGQLYQCLDLYIIASRQEGGPKTILESMACRVPLVTTRVGQAMDLVKHEENGLMVEPEAPEALAFCAAKALSDSMLREKMTKNGLITAEENTYLAYVPLWEKFFTGFVQTNE